jgi:hypothetical protein
MHRATALANRWLALRHIPRSNWRCPDPRQPGDGNGKPFPVGWIWGRFKMTNWKVDFDGLVQESMAFAKSIRVEPTSRSTNPDAKKNALGLPKTEPADDDDSPAIQMPRTIVELNRTLPQNPGISERDEIRQRVSNFRAHQERFAREREDFAASLLKKMLGRS